MKIHTCPSVHRTCTNKTTPSIHGARWRSWLRHYATNRQVAGSIPYGVTGIFQWHNPSGRTMALGSTQPLTEMSTRCIYWGGKGGWCVRLTTLPPSCAVVMKSGNLNFLEPSGPLQACNGTASPSIHDTNKGLEKSQQEEILKLVIMDYASYT